MPPFRPSLPLMISFAIPTTGILIATYLYNRPLPVPKERKISTCYELSSSLTTFPRSLDIVNPKKHEVTIDSRSITLLRSGIAKNRSGSAKEIGDEEILATFLKGFFGGWSFTPERGLLALLRGMGKKFIEVKYSDLPATGNTIQSLDGLSNMKLPEKGTVLFGGNFLILDVHIASESVSSKIALSSNKIEGGKGSLSTSYVDVGFGDPVISYVDVAFGSDQKNFSGLHRFEIRSLPAKKKKEEEITIWFSSLSCNPSINRPPFPKWIFGFHCWYAMCLFKDGIERVIRG